MTGWAAEVGPRPTTLTPPSELALAHMPRCKVRVDESLRTEIELQWNNHGSARRSINIGPEHTVSFAYPPSALLADVECIAD
jgi:hypothetical protein